MVKTLTVMSLFLTVLQMNHIELLKKWHSILVKVWLTYQLNTRVKGYVGDMSSLHHDSKGEPDTQEMVWTRDEGAVKKVQ